MKDQRLLTILPPPDRKKILNFPRKFPGIRIGNNLNFVCTHQCNSSSSKYNNKIYGIFKFLPTKQILQQIFWLSAFTRLFPTIFEFPNSSSFRFPEKCSTWTLNMNSRQYRVAMVAQKQHRQQWNDKKGSQFTCKKHRSLVTIPLHTLVLLQVKHLAYWRHQLDVAKPIGHQLTANIKNTIRHKNTHQNDDCYNVNLWHTHHLILLCVWQMLQIRCSVCVDNAGDAQVRQLQSAEQWCRVFAGNCSIHHRHRERH